MLPHSFLWGHLNQSQHSMSQLPSDAHITNLLSKISEQFSKSDSVYYMDMWPFSPPLMVLSSPSTASQAVQQHTLRKPPALTDLFYPITGGPDLIFINGELWKKSRSVFNPSFIRVTWLARFLQSRRRLSLSEIFCEIPAKVDAIGPRHAQSDTRCNC
jgi:cytochrome P450